MPRRSRAPGQSLGGDHRPSERPGGAKRGVAIDPLGYGRKRHIMADTLGLMVGVTVHSAALQDRDGAEELLRQTHRCFPFIE
jgi:hypothetical protein